MSRCSSARCAAAALAGPTRARRATSAWAICWPVRAKLGPPRAGRVPGRAACGRWWAAAGWPGGPPGQPASGAARAGRSGVGRARLACTFRPPGWGPCSRSRAG
jgi:hypothetical protein